MKLYLFSLAAGVLVGVIYGLLHVRSTAPPVIALVGLAGILIGEQAVPLVKEWVARKQPVGLGLVVAHLRSHSFGDLPTQAPDCGRSRVDRSADSRAPGGTP
jgi:XapX domain-containing protein